MNDQPPELLTVAQTPDYWSAHFRDKGLRMSARSLRAKAIKAGLCYPVDKQVLISPRQKKILHAGACNHFGTVVPYSDAHTAAHRRDAR